jgi:hypothetical protein
LAVICFASRRNRPTLVEYRAMSPLVFLTPVWFVFEIVHLVLSERFLGVKQIEAGTDPRQLGPGEPQSFVWSFGILLFWLWLVAMLFQSTGRAEIVALIVITVVGFFIRRSCSLRWVLVALTFEGALRIGMLLYLLAMIWRRI